MNRLSLGSILLALLLPATAYCGTRGGDCPASPTVLPAVLDGTDAYCATCATGVLQKIGDMTAQANALVTGANRERASIEEFVRAEETGSVNPRYATMTTDSGGLTYGAYQFSTTSGQLAGLLSYYLRMKNDPATTHLFGSYVHGGELVHGNSRVFTALLRQAANDPVMQYAQQRYFEAAVLDPAMASAAEIGIRTPLGAAILVDAMENGGYDELVAAARRRVPHIAGPSDESRFLAAFLDARDARYRSLARSRFYRPYLNGWLHRDADWRRMLASGNVDMDGRVNIASKGEFCGGGGEDAEAFRLWMAQHRDGRVTHDTYEL